MLMRSQQLLSIFSVPDSSDLKDTLQQLQLLGIVTSTAGSGSSSSGSDGDGSSSVRISHVFHTSLSTFRSELPPPPLRPLRCLSPEASADIAAWAQQVTCGL